MIPKKGVLDLEEIDEFERETVEHLGLVNLDNYGPMREYPSEKDVVIESDSINMDTWGEYYLGVLNIFRDGIELPIIREKKLRINFTDTGVHCNMFITDFFVNLEMWYQVVFAGGRIRPNHIVKEKLGVTSSTIKHWLDEHFVIKYRDKLPYILMNNIIDDGLQNWFYTNEFAFYLIDTINLKDDIDLCIRCPEYYEILHHDFSGEAFDTVNKTALAYTRRMMEIEMNAKHILGYDHCMANSHRAGQSPIKQLKEGKVYIGPKPDGNGDVYAHPINHSYINGGINDIADFFVDSALSRTAQILSHTNVGSSGHFARLLGLNNSGTFLSDTIDHCDTRSPIPFTIKTEKHLALYYDRWYQETARSVKKLITRASRDLIGKTVYIYSPMTCNSNTHHQGVCHQCYGELWHVNKDINIGKIAAELLSRILTQILLSAKHILEALVRKIIWPDVFYKYFEMVYNYIVLKDIDDLDTDGCWIVIDPASIEIDNEEDYDDESSAIDNMKEHIPMFKIVDKHGEEKVIEDSDSRDLYISNYLNNIIRKYAENHGDEMLWIPMDKLDSDAPLFYVRLLNNEISRLLTRLMTIINKKDVTESFSIPGILQEFIDTVVESNISIMGIHCEIILSNQIHNAMEMFKPIDWTNPNAFYKIVSLNDALVNNPSPTITLMYQYLAKSLYTPLTYQKDAPSFIDLFFMKNPQKFLDNKSVSSAYDTDDGNNTPWSIRIPPRPKKVPAPWTIKGFDDK